MTQPYLLPGLEVAVMRGRDQIFAQICRDLTKPTPDHVSIVGPRYFGKTVLVNALAERFSAPGSHYQVVCLWDLRHGTPQDDSTFKKALGRLLDGQLVAIGRSEFHEYLCPSSNDDPDIGGMIDDVMASLEAEGVRVLILLDDFDRLAQETQITKNLWDYLRSLAQRSNLRFLTTSRRGLRELIPSRESRTSDFWNIFGSKVSLPPFDARVLDNFLDPMVAGGYSVDDSARKELLNWTGGVPVLAVALCRATMESIRPGSIGKAQMDVVAEALLDTGRDTLATLWNDCDQEIQGDLIDLNANRDHANGLPDRRRRVLVERGYVLSDGAKFRPACRLISKYAALQEGATRDIRDLFKDDESERRTMRRLLEIKLAQIEGGNPEIRDFIHLAITGLSVGTRAALMSIRSVAQEAISIAWQAEFPGNVISSEVKQQLTLSWDRGGGGLNPEAFTKLDEINTRRTILRLAAGHMGRKKLTRCASRPMMLMIDHLHNIGDYGQHMNGIPPEQERPADFAFCAVACFTAIALLKRMAEDLSPPAASPQSPQAA